MTKSQHRVGVFLMFVAVLMFGGMTYVFSKEMFAAEASLSFPKEGSVTMDAAELQKKVTEVIHTVKFCLVISIVALVGTTVAIMGFLYSLITTPLVLEERPKIWPRPLPE